MKSGSAFGPVAALLAKPARSFRRQFANSLRINVRWKENRNGRSGLVNSMEQNVTKALQFGAWLGRGQAFAMVANLSLASQAECLRNIRDSESYKSVCDTWEQFCTQFVGASRRHVDQIIHNLEEFGAAYFRLSEIVKISPEAYRQLNPRIEGEEIEIGGERFALTPENAGNIRRAIQQMRAGLLNTNSQTQVPPLEASLRHLNSRLDVCLDEISRLADRPLEPPEESELRGLFKHVSHRMNQISRSIRCAGPGLLP
jgi:hypothetical protein